MTDTVETAEDNFKTSEGFEIDLGGDPAPVSFRSEAADDAMEVEDGNQNQDTAQDVCTRAMRSNRFLNVLKQEYSNTTSLVDSKA